MARERDEATSSEMRHDWLADRWVIIAPHRTARPHDFVRVRPGVVDSTDCPFCYGHEDSTPEAIACYLPGSESVDHARGGPPKWHVRVVPNKFPAVNRTADAMSGLDSSGVPSYTDLPSAKRASVLAGADSSDGLHHHQQDVRQGGQQAGENLDPQQASTSVCDSVCETQPLADRPDTEADEDSTSSVNLFLRRDLKGGHEVIIESPLHLQSITQLDRTNTSLVFRAYRDRLAHWLTDQKIGYAVVFKNVGQDAGASLFHTHSQLIATDVIPRAVELSVDRMKLFAEKESECIFCRMKDDELEQEIRVVEETPDFLAFCPFASRLPALITVVPKEHQCEFESINDHQLDQLSWLAHRLIRRIERCFPDAAYNFIIHTAPKHKALDDCYHWRMELFPRLTKLAGFEWGSDCYINPLAPEAAAEALRKAGV